VDIQLACSTIGWGREGFVEAVEAIANIGFDGVECPARLVREYEDRLHVFEEMLEISGLRLASMMQHSNFLDRETADETVERVANTARFLGAVGAPCLVVSPNNPENEDVSDDDWTTAAAVLEEMGIRCHEFGVELAFRPRSGYLGGSDKGMKKLLGMVSPEAFSLCCDTAELTLAEISVERFFKNHEGRIVHVRLRDASGAKRRSDTTSDARGSAPSFGRGAVDFAKVAKILAKAEYTGWVSVEFAGEDHPPRVAAESAFRYVMRKSGLFH
jgi:sugar phosphate isomerase/epimerase